MSSFRDEGEVEGQVAYNLRSRKVMVDVGPSNRSKKQRLCERERERDEDKRQRDEIAKRNGWSFHSIDDDDPWGCLRKRDGLPNLIVYLNDIPRGKQPPGELLRNSGTPSVQQPCSASASSESAYSEPGEPLRSRNIIKPKAPQKTLPSKPQTPPPNRNPTTQERESTFNPTSVQYFDLRQPNGKADMEAYIRRALDEHLGPDRHVVDEHNYNKWVSWANMALDYYNLKQGANFKLANIKGVVSDSGMPRRLVHISFGAKSDDGSGSDSYKVFFAEMRVPWDRKDEHIVHGCCTLEKTDSGSDFGATPCSLCGPYGYELLHPTRRYGCCVTSGDPFTDLASYY